MKRNNNLFIPAGEEKQNVIECKGHDPYFCKLTKLRTRQCYKYIKTRGFVKRPNIVVSECKFADVHLEAKENNLELKINRQAYYECGYQSSTTDTVLLSNARNGYFAYNLREGGLLEITSFDMN